MREAIILAVAVILGAIIKLEDGLWWWSLLLLGAGYYCGFVRHKIIHEVDYLLGKKAWT